MRRYLPLYVSAILGSEERSIVAALRNRSTKYKGKSKSKLRGAEWRVSNGEMSEGVVWFGGMWEEVGDEGCVREARRESREKGWLG